MVKIDTEEIVPVCPFCEKQVESFLLSRSVDNDTFPRSSQASSRTSPYELNVAREPARRSRRS